MVTVNDVLTCVVVADPTPVLEEELLFFYVPKGSRHEEILVNVLQRAGIQMMTVLVTDTGYKPDTVAFLPSIASPRKQSKVSQTQAKSQAMPLKASPVVKKEPPRKRKINKGSEPRRMRKRCRYCEKLFDRRGLGAHIAMVHTHPEKWRGRFGTSKKSLSSTEAVKKLPEVRTSQLQSESSGEHGITS